MGLRPTRTPLASSASALAWAVPLEPLTIAVPVRLKSVLDTPEGMALLSELLDHEQVRGKQAVEAAMRQLERER